MEKTFKRSLVPTLTLFVCACGGASSAPEVSWPNSLKAQIGQTYEVRWSQSTQTAGDAGSSGSSNTRMTHIESVIDAGPDALVLEYDMYIGASDIDRRRSWQLPARVRLTPDNEMILLNTDDLKARNDDWLAWGNYNQSHCGQWIFTWTAQKIECDPNSVIDGLETFNIRRANLKAGAPYTSFGGLAPATLEQAPSEDGMLKLTATLELDADKVRREKAESDLIVAQIIGKTVPTLEEAMQARAAEKTSGSITVTYTLDPAGEPIRRVKITEVTIVSIEGVEEVIKTTETVERTLLTEVQE